MSVEAPTKRPEGLQVFQEASSLLLKADSESDSLAQILNLACSVLGADAFAVWREFEERKTWRVVAKSGLSEGYRTEVPATGVAPRSVWTVEDTSADDRLAETRSAYEQEGIRSMLVVPWLLGATTSGTIVFYWRVRRNFTPEDETYACSLCNISAAAIRRLDLQEQNAREKRRLAFLAEASEVLASSLDYEATLDRVAHLAVERIADWCTVHLVEDGAVTRLVTAHADPAMVTFVAEYAERYPETIVPDRGLGKVLATGLPEVYAQITDEMILAAALDAEHLAMLRRLALTASIVVPLIARGKVLGAIRLLGSNGRHFSADDVQLAEDLARRSAVAIENARLHRAIVDQQSELRLSHAAAHMGSWSWDIDRNKLYWSDEFKALHGLTPNAEPTEQAGYDLVHPDDRAAAQNAFWQTLNSDTATLNSEHRALTPDGRVLWLQARGRIDRDATGRATRVAGLVIDVTESRLAEQALRRTEKLAAAGRLAATVAHEVNNPLEALVNLIYLARAASGLSPEAAEYLRVADGELKRMAHIVRQTLGFYRESTVPMQVDLECLVSEVLDLYRSRAITRSQTLCQNANQSGLSVYANGGELKQVVANLVSNAIDATPAGGRVTATAQRTGEWIEVLVTDTGSGISKENRKHLFEPFFTTKSDVGTGLGLWVSKGIVEKHGGTICVDPAGSAPGTTVRFRLPAYKDASTYVEART
jgi:PAS domain S-box-containing protein